ncbi:hypothetical protein [Lewinella sp. LCG006]|uniref:hypothetical protein n=1 Tax=Lewinella sp. LCG006 TaxID=3231911 RepID=UPI003460135C
MQNHHLLDLLNSFSRKEMTRFVEFSRSPYHHKHEMTQVLINYLDKCYPDFSERLCDRKVIWKRLFPKQAFDSSKLALLFTYAWRLCENFLIEEQLAQHPQREQWLLTALRERRQWTIYERQLKKSKKALTQTILRDTDYYRQVMALAEEANEFYTVWEPQAQDQSLVEKEHALDQYYVLEKLRDAVQLQMRRQILRDDYSARLLEGVLEELRLNEEAYREAPAVQVYYQLYRMMDEPSLAAYQAALAIFQENEHCFRLQELTAIYNYLQNFCIAQINRNELPFLRELFGLYNAQLARQLLHEGGYLIEWHYKNIVTAALRLGELAWVDHFIETQKDALAPAAAENAYRFNKAAYCHAVGEFGKVLELLTQVEYSDLRYNLGAKALLLRTYYELDEFEALHALVESFRQYLQRNRLLADSRRSGYYHLFRLTRRLAKLRANYPYLDASQATQRLAKIKTDMEQTGAIFNRAWLERKLEALEKSRKAEV